MAAFTKTTDGDGKDVVRCFTKGAAPAVMSHAASALSSGKSIPWDDDLRTRAEANVQRMEADGLRVMAAGVRDLDPESLTAFLPGDGSCSRSRPRRSASESICSGADTADATRSRLPRGSRVNRRPSPEGRPRPHGARSTAAWRARSTAPCGSDTPAADIGPAKRRTRPMTLSQRGWLYNRLGCGGSPAGFFSLSAVGQRGARAAGATAHDHFPELPQR
jgi:hypothetical protein